MRWTPRARRASRAQALGPAPRAGVAPAGASPSRPRRRLGSRGDLTRSTLQREPRRGNLPHPGRAGRRVLSRRRRRRCRSATRLSRRALRRPQRAQPERERLRTWRGHLPTRPCGAPPITHRAQLRPKRPLREDDNAPHRPQLRGMATDGRWPLTTSPAGHQTAPVDTARRRPIELSYLPRAPSYRYSVQGLVAAERAGQVHEAEQDVGVPLVADLHPWAADEPGQRPLHHVPVAAQPAAGLDAAPGDPWG
jgi:hypothetical protein